MDELGRRLAQNEKEPTRGATAGHRRAAVLAILYKSNGALWLPLIERPHGPGVHAGQFALPGGAFEPEDQTLARTALRETQEEIGIDPESLTILGSLPMVTVRVSGFVVLPFVAWSTGPPEFVPNLAEVERVVQMAVSMLPNPRTDRTFDAPSGTHQLIHEFHLREGRVWGATARILHSLGQVLPPT